jgi:hypothetical protein
MSDIHSAPVPPGFGSNPFQVIPAPGSHRAGVPSLAPRHVIDFSLDDGESRRRAIPVEPDPCSDSSSPVTPAGSGRAAASRETEPGPAGADGATESDGPVSLSASGAASASAGAPDADGPPDRYEAQLAIARSALHARPHYESFPAERDEEGPGSDPTSMCCSVVRAAAEVLAGMRPIQHLSRWVVPHVLGQIGQHARLIARSNQQGKTRRPVHVRRVRVDQRGPLAEAAVILEDQGRTRAATVRMEAWQGKWRVTDLDFI